MIVEQTARNWAPFENFVLNASRVDAGAAAAQTHLGVDLGAYACALFEKEPSTAWSSRDRALALSAEAEHAQPGMNSRRARVHHLEGRQRLLVSTTIYHPAQATEGTY